MNINVFLLLLNLGLLGHSFGQTLFSLDKVEKYEKTPPSLLTSTDDPDILCRVYSDTLSTLILKFLERLRSHMSDGIPSMGIPPLDPLHIQNTSFSESKSFQYDVEGSVADTTVEGLKSFNVTHISTSILHLQANLSLTIPYFMITGKYQLHGSVLAIFPVKGSGPYLLTPTNVVTSVTTKLHFEHGKLQITSLNFKVDMTKLLVKFDGLYGGGNVGSFINRAMNRWGVGIFHRIEPRIHDRLRDSLITVINEKLKEMPLSGLVGIFDGVSSCKRAVVRSLVTNVDTSSEKTIET